MFKNTFQNRVMSAQDLGFKNKQINSDGTVTLFHVTTPQNKELILEQGFKKGSYFAISTSDKSHTTLKDFVKQDKFKNGYEILTVNVDPRFLTYEGRGELISTVQLFNINGVYTNELQNSQGKNMKKEISVFASVGTVSGLSKMDHHKINKSLLSEPRENMIKFCDKTWGVSENRRNGEEYTNGKDELTNSQLSQMVIEWASMRDLSYDDLRALWKQVVGSPLELPNNILGLSRRELLNLSKEELVDFIVQFRG